MKGSWWPFGSDNGDVLEEARGLLLVGEQNLSCSLCLPRCLSCFCGWCISTHVDAFSLGALLYPFVYPQTPESSFWAPKTNSSSPQMVSRSSYGWHFVRYTV